MIIALLTHLQILRFGHIFELAALLLILNELKRSLVFTHFIGLLRVDLCQLLLQLVVVQLGDDNQRL